MLVLTRKAGEKILVGEDITITVIESGNGTMRIGIEAPRSTTIHRAELVDDVGRRNAAAAADIDEAALRALLAG